MYYAGTRNVSLLINPDDDWWCWNRYITGLARSLLVQDILLANWIKPTPEQLARYEAKVERYEAEMEEYASERAAMGTIWQAIYQTVARRYLEWFVTESDDAVSLYRKLKEKLEPSVEDQKRRVRERYRGLLGSKPSHQSMGKWLDEWEDVLIHCERLKMEESTEGLGTLDFLTALKKIEPRYAQDRLTVLRAVLSLDVFDEIDKYRKHREARASKNRMQYLR